MADFNDDGHDDLITGCFQGRLYLIEGSENGFRAPVVMNDKSEKFLTLNKYWSGPDRAFITVDRNPEGVINPPDMSISVAPIDWDQDGDLDLLIGAFEGHLYIQYNEGSATEAKFAGVNHMVKHADGKPLKVPGHHFMPSLGDFDGDGRFDIITGSANGGAYWFRNVGEAGAPEFAPPEELVSPLPTTTGWAEVPMIDGEPARSGIRSQVCAVDYDNDGDLDLLLGDYCNITPEQKSLNAEQIAQRDELRVKLTESYDELNRLYQQVIKETGEKTPELDTEDPRHQKIMKKMRAVETALLPLESRPVMHGYVWLYRRSE